MTTFAILKADLGSYSVRPNITDSRLESCIRIAEAVIYRKLRVPAMVASTTLTFSTRTAAKPTRFREVISLTPQDKGKWDFLRPERLRSSNIWQSTWVANGNAAYTLEGDNFVIAPEPSGSPVADLLYYQALEGLSVTNTTNSILSDNYDLFLSASLAALYEYVEDEQLEMKYLAKTANIITEVNDESRKSQRGNGAGHRRTGTSTP